MSRAALTDAGGAEKPIDVPVVGTKLHVPTTRDAVVRTRLLHRLSDDDASLVLVVASPGAGKSTVLAQWADHADGQGFAWVSIDAGDNDPARLWAHVLAALERAGLPADERLHARAQEAQRVSGFLPELVNALSRADEQIVLVLDDFHLLADEEVVEEVRYLLDHLPGNCRIAIGTRADPPLPLARLRAAGRLCELRDDDLRFTAAEAADLISAELGAGVSPDVVDALVTRVEGWAVGLYLAALTARDVAGMETSVPAFSGVRRHVVDYFVDEVLADLEPTVRRFLLESSVLDRLSGDLCDFVLERRGSAALLEHLVRSNRLVVPLDDERRWYRYHNLFAEFLRAELSRAEPDVVPGIHLRASEWFDRADLPEEAIGHAIASGDVEVVGRLIARALIRLERIGRFMTVAGWMMRLGEDQVAADPRLAISAAWIALNSADTHAAERWLDAAAGRIPEQPFDEYAPIGVVGAMTRAVSAYFRGAPEEAAREAQRAIDAAPPSVWSARASVIVGASLYWRGHLGRARAQFERLLPILQGESIPLVITLGYLGAIALEEGDVGAARAASERAVAIAERTHLSRHLRTAPAHMTLCRLALHEGDASAARRRIVTRLEPLEEQLDPIQRAALLLVKARVSIALGETRDAEELLCHAADVVALCDEPVTVLARLAVLEPAIATVPQDNGKSDWTPEGLSRRELDVLRLLPTRLTKREIGRQLHISSDTVGTHTRSIYRKLNVHSRAAAVTRARELGMVPGSPR